MTINIGVTKAKYLQTILFYGFCSIFIISLGLLFVMPTAIQL